MAKETHLIKISWRGITIEIAHTPSFSKVIKENYGYQLSHLGITSENRVPLPITETGYLSVFENSVVITEYGSPENFVIAHLNEAAKKRAWKEYIRRTSQLSLFS